MDWGESIKTSPVSPPDYSLPFLQSIHVEHQNYRPWRYSPGLFPIQDLPTLEGHGN
jgi:hypothetical protein